MSKAIFFKILLFEGVLLFLTREVNWNTSCMEDAFSGQIYVSDAGTHLTKAAGSARRDDQIRLKDLHCRVSRHASSCGGHQVA